jgi:hypothetical protein
VQFCGANKIAGIGRSLALGHVVAFSLWDSNGISLFDAGNVE